MQYDRKTVIVAGASQGIGAAIVQAFLARGYNVVGIPRNATKSKELSPSDDLALIDGDIGQFNTAQKVAELATNEFGSSETKIHENKLNGSATADSRIEKLNAAGNTSPATSVYA
jgi:NAD(P)-dependent dehydrogenase (short-subunit alcohol dehydrogenase family)